MANNHARRLPNAAILGPFRLFTSQVFLATDGVESRLGFSRHAAVIVVLAAVVAFVRVLPAGTMFQFEYTLIDFPYVIPLHGRGAIRWSVPARTALIAH